MVVAVLDDGRLVRESALVALPEELPLGRRRHVATVCRQQIANRHRPPADHLLHERHAAAAGLDPRARLRRREPLRTHLRRLLRRHDRGERPTHG